MFTPPFLCLKKSPLSINFVSWCKCILFFTSLLPQYPVHRPIISTNFLVFPSPLLSSSLFPLLFFSLSSLPLSFLFPYAHVSFPYNTIHFLWTRCQEHGSKWQYLLNGWVNKWMIGKINSLGYLAELYSLWLIYIAIKTFTPLIRECLLNVKALLTFLSTYK